MKTHTTQSSALLLMLFILLALASCKKDEQLEVLNPGMSFIVNGTAKSATGSENVYATKGDGNTITITAKLTATNELITFVIPGIRGKGEFPITKSAEATYVNGPVPAANRHLANSGTIRITTFQSNGVKGTFEFDSSSLTGSLKKITEGSFEAEIQK
ncbi:hypothetical protein [Desertivirga brevis]|uniref:hypothetical protein n=1 Tax=Desertivirga brevis TaxID=2810310 RepID=UPI001A973DB4|nr:hypothetical protein [Pedobacter sp. SYSU D00873]